MVRRDVGFLEVRCWSDPSDIHQQESVDMLDLPTILQNLEL